MNFNNPELFKNLNPASFEELIILLTAFPSNIGIFRFNNSLTTFPNVYERKGRSLRTFHQTSS